MDKLLTSFGYYVASAPTRTHTHTHTHTHLSWPLPD